MNATLNLIKGSAVKEDVSLGEHQKRVVEKIKKAPGVLVYHGLGSGKTLASIAAAEDIGGKKKIIVPASLRENYRKELKKFVNNPKGYDVESYNKAVKEELIDGDVVVMDEAHRIGGEGTQSSSLPRKINSGKIIMLTGTPVRNRPNEIVPILRAIAGDRGAPLNRKEFDKRFIDQRKVYPGFINSLLGATPGYEYSLKNKNGLARLFKGRVDYYPAKGDYPSSKVVDVEVGMTKAQNKLYQGLMKANPILRRKVRKNLPPNKTESKRLNAFLSAVRQVSNNPSAFDVRMSGDPVNYSPKMMAMVNSILDKSRNNKKFKAVVYSSYLGSGLVPLAQHLAERGMKVDVFDGSLDDKARKEVVDRYNKGKTKVLLISGAGSEGLDLKGTSLMQVMEPHWNQSRIDQVVGRVIRNKSHSHLPKKDRNVTVEKYYAVPPKTFMNRIGLTKRDTGADQYIKNLSDKKQELIDDILGLLKEVG